MPKNKQPLHYIHELVDGAWNEATKESPITKHTIKAIAFEVARREFAEGCRMAIKHERNK